MPEESEFQPVEFRDTPDPRAAEREKIRQTVDRIADNLKDPNKVKAGFLERVNFQLSGSSIDFLAVTHSPNLLNSTEAVKQIEDAISQADVVVLESSIIEKQWDTKDNPNRQIIQTDKGFYTKIQEKLYEQSKIMMILDPQTPESMVAVKQAHTVATGAGILSGVLAAREAILAIAKKNNPDKYGRRGFLKAIAEVGGLISTGALAEQLYSVGYKAEGITYYDPKFQLDDQILLGFDNYRDLVVGQQLSQICAGLQLH